MSTKKKKSAISKKYRYNEWSCVIFKKICICMKGEIMKHFLRMIGVVGVLFCMVGCKVECGPDLIGVTPSSDGVPISYSVYGEGETALVFVHGWSCDSRYWMKQVPFFSKKFRVVTVDLAGHGHSGMDRETYTMEAYGADVAAVVERLDLDRVVLIGHSMGGTVIAEGALLLTERVIGLIGVDTLQNVRDAVPQEQYDAMLDPIKNDFASATRGFVGSMFPANADPHLKDVIISDMAAAPSRVAISSLEQYLTRYLKGTAGEPFKHLSVPVKAVNARLWPTDVEANRSVMTSFDVEYVDDSGHFLQLESPHVFNATLMNVIDSIE